MDNYCIQIDSNPFSENSNPSDADRFQYDARFPEYGGFATRLKSFEKSQWSPVDRRYLAEAGFFDPGRPHTVQCFYCGLRMAFEWNGIDDPWRDHAKHVGSDGCAYLCHMKDQAFVRGKGQAEAMGEDAGATCFDRGGGESGWIPCQEMNSCRLCVWEFWMIPPQDDNDSD